MKFLTASPAQEKKVVEWSYMIKIFRWLWLGKWLSPGTYEIKYLSLFEIKWTHFISDSTIIKNSSTYLRRKVSE